MHFVEFSPRETPSPRGKNPLSPSENLDFKREKAFWTLTIRHPPDKFSMDFRPSFKQILRGKMAEETTIVTAANSSNQVDPAHMAYLIGQLEVFKMRGKKQHYPAPKVRPQRKPHTLSPLQKQAFTFIKSWIHDLPEGFTENELKRAYRQAALILHPDRGGSTLNFIELKTQYENLKTVFTKATPA